MQLKDRVAIVTGGGSGIGRAIAELFSANGALVVVADIVEDRAVSVASTLRETGARAIGVAADVSSDSDVQRMVDRGIEEFGRVDILVNNAGLSVGDTILDFDEGAWDLNIDVVLKGVYLCSRAVLPSMLEQGRGVILNIGSVNGLMGVGESAYSAAKAGMINLTQNMAIHFGDKGVRVNCLAPGTIRTPIWAERLERDPEVFDNLAKWYPLRRVGEPDDVSKAALFLCSDDASWITGIVLPVDGGLTAGSYGMNQALQGVREG
jgi:meso-butanediol dehydrogenase / (S,S)-butanediol dehydrogenase / diacetyl reductase